MCMLAVDRCMGDVVAQALERTVLRFESRSELRSAMGRLGVSVRGTQTAARPSGGLCTRRDDAHMRWDVADRVLNLPDTKAERGASGERAHRLDVGTSCDGGA